MYQVLGRELALYGYECNRPYDGSAKVPLDRNKIVNRTLENLQKIVMNLGKSREKKTTVETLIKKYSC